MSNLTVVNVTNPAGCYVCGRTVAEGHAPDCTFGMCLFCKQPLSEAHLPGCLTSVMDSMDGIVQATTAALTPLFQEARAAAEVAAERMGRWSVENFIHGFTPAAPSLREALRQFQAEQKRREKESRRHFDEMVRALQKAGYRVQVNWVTELVRKRGRTISCRMPNRAKIAQVRGKGIRAVFATVGSSVGIEGEITSAHPRFDGCLVAENARCFDKWSKAPMTIELPRDPAEVIAWLQYLGSDEGYEISNGYLYLNGNPFPNRHDQKVGQRPQIRITSLDLKPMNIHEMDVTTSRPSPPVLLHGLGDGLRVRLLPREEIESALVEMGVEGGYAAATELELVQARLNAVLSWRQENSESDEGVN